MKLGRAERLDEEEMQMRKPGRSGKVAVFFPFLATIRSGEEKKLTDAGRRISFWPGWLREPQFFPPGGGPPGG